MSRDFPLQVKPAARKLLPKLFFPAAILAACSGLVGCAHNQAVVRPEPSAPAQTSAAPTPAPATPVDPATAAIAVRAEQIRTECITGRRLICGRVLMVATNGLVVDSGYTDLLRPPLGQSWVIPGTVSANRDPNVLELNEPGSPCIGLVFLTDVSKRKKVHKYDYVVLIGYPAGQYVYKPLPEVEKPIRTFAGGLDSAVRMRLQAEENNSPANAPAAK